MESRLERETRRVRHELEYHVDKEIRKAADSHAEDLGNAYEHLLNYFERELKELREDVDDAHDRIDDWDRRTRNRLLSLKRHEIDFE